MDKFIFKDDEESYMIVEWISYSDFKTAYRELTYDYQHEDRNYSNFYYDLNKILNDKNQEVTITQTVVFTE
jgi:hypothetical protein